mgnify:CR=1 FL=1
MNRLKFSLSQKQIAFCSIAVLTVLLIPMVIIGFYNHPSYDDFGYAALTVKAYREHSSIITAALKQIKISYYGWQGTYSLYSFFRCIRQYSEKHFIVCQRLFCLFLL